MPHIFISYAKKDTRPLAEALYDALNAVPGLTAWMDKSLVADASWAQQIEHEIERADYIVVLLSPDVNRKPPQPRSFVLNEIDYAQQEHKPILPVLAERTKVPVQLAGIQHIDLTATPHNPEKIVDRVCQRYHIVRPRVTSSPVVEQSARTVVPAPARRPVRPLLFVIGGAVLLIPLIMVAGAIISGDIITPLRWFGWQVNGSGLEVITAANADHIEQIYEWRVGDYNVTALDWSPDGTRFVVSTSDGAAILNPQFPRAEPQFFPIGDFLDTAAFSPDGSRIVTAGYGLARVYDLSTGSQVFTLRIDGEHREYAAFYTPDGRSIITTGEGIRPRIQFWDAETGWEQASLDTPAANRAYISDDGLRLLSNNFQITQIWDLHTRELLLTLDATFVTFADFSSDGERIVTADSDGHDVQVWDAATGDLLTTMNGHTSVVWTAEFSPDGSLVITASGDGTIGIWDAASGQILNLLRLGSDEPNFAMLSPDGTRIMSGGPDGIIRVWGVPA